MKTKRLIPIVLVGICCLATLPFAVKGTSADGATFRVDYYYNYKRQEFTLSSGFSGIGNSLLYTTQNVNANAHAVKPTNPERKNWDFAGWFKDAECANEWSFAEDIVSKNTRLFAKWERTASDVEPEPAYTPPSTVLEESASENYVLNSMMGFKLDAGQFRVSKNALARLVEMKDDIRPLLEYKVKASKSFSATYVAGMPDGHISISCDGSVANYTVVSNQTEYVSSDTNFEGKAQNYENQLDNENENYHVMLAGSSSMEFWETFKEDLDPIVTYNHGIGGTKIDVWKNKFNQRLVYPYKPKLITYYVGINDVKDGAATSTVMNNLISFFDTTHAALPDTKILYVLLNKVPLVKTRFNDVDTINNAVLAYQEENASWFSTVNPGEAMLKPDTGEPHAAYYRNDGIHMTYAGYAIWSEMIKKEMYSLLKK